MFLSFIFVEEEKWLEGPNNFKWLNVGQQSVNSSLVASRIGPPFIFTPKSD